MPQKKGKMKIPILRKFIQIQTAFIKVLNTKGKHFVDCRVTFDMGSQITYCTKALKP